ncbi:MAG: gamma-glutamyl-gamma-aminobutyrate hydrolase family protein [Candidatus Aminicenantes bacterium]|nr:MAG: gamma-glutamyl-gamma-aminobutyrate hydrolase family protein [Candidatus Aminicenantes bacterium]
MKDEILAESFDIAISRPLQQADWTADFVRIPRTRKTPDLSKYSHFILSGSEASVVEDNPWEEKLKEIIDNIIDMKKPLLGICYGHQFIVRALLGRRSVRKTETPEFGWMNITLSKNPLFEGIVAPNPPVFMVSHYDEVCRLTDDFQILASTPRCGVHAFQYKDLPVWGVQFHPEYNVEEANEIFDIIKKRDSSFSIYFFNALRDEAQLEQNERIFLNFLQSS